MQKQIEINVDTPLPAVAWDELQQYDFNDLKDESRQNVDKLKLAILESGFSFPFFVWGKYVIDGTARKRALQALEREGYSIPDLPVVALRAKDLKDARRLVLQASSQYGRISQDSFKHFLSSMDIELEELDVELPEIDIRLDALDEPDYDDDDDDEIDEPAERQKRSCNRDGSGIATRVDSSTRVERGDIFDFIVEHGDRVLTYRLGCLDCTKDDDLDTLLGDAKIDLVLTDPPYGIDITLRGVGAQKGLLPKIGGDEDTEAARHFFARCEERGLDKLIVWGGNYFTDFLPPSPGWIAWDKDIPEGLLYGDGELAWTNVFTSNRFYKIKWMGNLVTCPDFDAEIDATPLKVGSTGGVSATRYHPTQKPTALMMRVIADAMHYGKLDVKRVLDGFSGSATTVIAGIGLGVSVYACEIMGFYVEQGVRRILKRLRTKGVQFNFLVNNQVADPATWA